jgi:hypothetical protein
MYGLVLCVYVQFWPIRLLSLQTVDQHGAGVAIGLVGTASSGSNCESMGVHLPRKAASFFCSLGKVLVAEEMLSESKPCLHIHGRFTLLTKSPSKNLCLICAAGLGGGMPLGYRVMLCAQHACTHICRVGQNDIYSVYGW